MFYNLLCSACRAPLPACRRLVYVPSYPLPSLLLTMVSSFNPSLQIDTNADGSYKIGKWVSEKMPSPRLSHSSLLLPNGKIILMGGAKRGQLGDAAAGGVSMANDPNFWPVVFDPQAPVDSADRWVTLQRTQIPRMLHSAVGLTTNGTVFVAGFDRADKFWSPFNYSKSPTGFSEYRLELFSPPEVFETDKQPEIVSDVPDVVAYGEFLLPPHFLPTYLRLPRCILLFALLQGLLPLSLYNTIHQYNTTHTDPPQISNSRRRDFQRGVRHPQRRPDRDLRRAGRPLLRHPHLQHAPTPGWPGAARRRGHARNRHQRVQVCRAGGSPQLEHRPPW